MPVPTENSGNQWQWKPFTIKHQREVSADTEVGMTESALFTDGLLPFQQR